MKEQVAHNMHHFYNVTLKNAYINIMHTPATGMLKKNMEKKFFQYAQKVFF